MNSVCTRSFAFSWCIRNPTACFALSSLLTPLQMRTKLSCMCFVPVSFFLVSAMPSMVILFWVMYSTISGSLCIKPQMFQVPILSLSFNRSPFFSPCRLPFWSVRLIIFGRQNTRRVTSFFANIETRLNDICSSRQGVWRKWHHYKSF